MQVCVRRGGGRLAGDFLFFLLQFLEWRGAAAGEDRHTTNPSHPQPARARVHTARTRMHTVVLCSCRNRPLPCCFRHFAVRAPCRTVPQDVYKTHLTEGRAPAGAAAVDSARQNLASTFVNAFVNAAFGQVRRRGRGLKGSGRSAGAACVSQWHTDSCSRAAGWTAQPARPCLPQPNPRLRHQRATWQHHPHPTPQGKLATVSATN